MKLKICTIFCGTDTIKRLKLGNSCIIIKSTNMEPIPQKEEKGMDYGKIASEVIKYVGGKGNVKSCLLYTSDAADE